MATYWQNLTPDKKKELYLQVIGIYDYRELAEFIARHLSSWCVFASPLWAEEIDGKFHLYIEAKFSRPGMFNFVDGLHAAILTLIKQPELLEDILKVAADSTTLP